MENLDVTCWISRMTVMEDRPGSATSSCPSLRHIIDMGSSPLARHSRWTSFPWWADMTPSPSIMKRGGAEIFSPVKLGSFLSLSARGLVSSQPACLPFIFKLTVFEIDSPTSLLAAHVYSPWSERATRHITSVPFPMIWMSSVLPPSPVTV